MAVFFELAIRAVFFIYFLTLQINNPKFTKNNVKNVRPVAGAGIQTHDLWTITLLP